MKNVAASVRAKLLNLSRAESVPLHALMEQYATGRFLYRLSTSKYRERFILKGAQLFRIWEAEEHRPTRDLDFLGCGEATEEAVQSIFTELTQIEVDPPDGLEWGEVTVSPIRDEVAYGGFRARVNVDLAGARLSIQIDVGFGDAITPEATEKEWHELLPFPSARLLVYPPETVVAEKLEAAVSLGTDNSRMKDFYDLHWLQSHLNFNGAVMTEAIANTFARRGTEVPGEPPIAFTNEFYHDEQKLVQWNAFLRKGKLEAGVLEEVMKDISRFLLPVLADKVSDQVWTPPGKWTSTSKPS
ncbi:MAG: nucleotidyl transferase AbiEii/AbiGii toxin family protein [Verrucomicrobiales bacterium]|nr:nucleotidyl transferase AbiEii/AbiGii toxin family protein [Verrucomicrobiales bacterium]